MAFSVEPKKLIASGESCKLNGPKLEEAFKANVVDPLKKIYDETGLQRFEDQHSLAQKAYQDSVAPFSVNIKKAGEALVELGETAERISKGNVK